jgi:hypothetical protein
MGAKVIGKTVDILIESKKGKKVAIEFDGPTHYLYESRELVAPTVLISRVMETQLKVVRVPYWEIWNKKSK